jgi:hypothetical protein
MQEHDPASCPPLYHLSSQESQYRKLCSTTGKSECCFNSWLFVDVAVLDILVRFQFSLFRFSLVAGERKKGFLGLQINSWQIRCTLLPVNLMIMVHTLHLVWFSVQSMFFSSILVFNPSLFLLLDPGSYSSHVLCIWIGGSKKNSWYFLSKVNRAIHKAKCPPDKSFFLTPLVK